MQCRHALVHETVAAICPRSRWSVLIAAGWCATRHELLPRAQRRSNLLRKFHLNLYHRPINEHRLRASPLNPFGVERNYIPEDASVAATAWLKCGQLLIHLSGNKAVLVPELYDPAVWNPRKNRPCGPAPIRCQNRFPDHQNCQVHRPLLFQECFDCGGPPQTTRSCGRQQDHQASILSRSIKLVFELISVVQP
jgi:hypothetical protein